MRDAIPTIRDLRLAIRQPGPNNDLINLCRRRRSSATRPRSSSRARSRRSSRPSPSSSSSGPTSPSSWAGSATSARGRATTTPTATSPASSRSSTRSRVNDQTNALTPVLEGNRLSEDLGLEHPQSHERARAPPRSSGPTRATPGATPTATSTATRPRCRPAHEPPAAHASRPRRARSPASSSSPRPCCSCIGTGASSSRRELQGPRDLRQRLVRHQGRGRQDRRGQGRQDRVAGRDAAEEGRGRARHPAGRLPGLPPGRELHDPPAVADRRGVRRVHADQARRRSGRRSRRELKKVPERSARSRPAPAAARDALRRRHLEPGRDRPDRQHPADAPAPAPGADHRRARHGPGRQRARSCTTSCAAPTRRWPSSTASWRSSRRENRTLASLATQLRHGAAPAGPRQAPGRRLHHQGEQGGHGDRRAPRSPSSATSRSCLRSCASCGRR